MQKEVRFFRFCVRDKQNGFNERMSALLNKECNY